MIGNIITVLATLWLLRWSEKPKRRCKCGRTKHFYFGQIHSKTRYMAVFWLYFILAVMEQKEAPL